MKPKHQRLCFVAASMIFLLAGSLLVAGAFRENLIFFYSPSEIHIKTLPETQMVRIGGLVENGSIKKPSDNETRFRVTDNNQSITVEYIGMLPALFREGQGVVVEGYMTKDYFDATRVLTKHDENYMPKEVVESLKKSGRWQEAQ